MPPSIRLAEKHFGFHGPYDIKGDFTLDGQVEVKPELANKVSLCRCGYSENKPFCSGAHFDIRFIDDDNDCD